MAMFEKVLVVWELREVTLVILLHPVVDLAQRLLLYGEQIEGEDGHDFTVPEYGMTADSSLRLVSRR